VRTAYTRRRGAYSYDIEVHEAVLPSTPGRFYARVVNMVRRESGQTVSINAQLPDEYAATRDDAVSQIEAAVAAWVKNPGQKS
jgi:hypothetical protein